MTYSNLRSSAANTYANIGLETDVLSASPVQLIVLLLDGANAAIEKARLYIQAGKAQGRQTSISKAIDIIESGLKASLNLEAGGEVAQNLATTYDLIIVNLLQANLRASIEKLEQASQLLQPIREAWHTLAKQSHTSSPEAASA